MISTSGDVLENQISIHNLKEHRFALKRQFPLKEDPKEQLLRHIMGVSTYLPTSSVLSISLSAVNSLTNVIVLLFKVVIAILIVLLTTTIIAGIIFLRRGGNFGEDSFKLMTQTSTSSGDNLL